MGFPGGSTDKESACNAGDLGSILGLGRSAGEGNGYPLQYSDLENFMNCIVYGVEKSQTWPSDFHSHSKERENGVAKKLSHPCSTTGVQSLPIASPDNNW